MIRTHGYVWSKPSDFKAKLVFLPTASRGITIQRVSYKLILLALPRTYRRQNAGKIEFYVIMTTLPYAALGTKALSQYIYFSWATPLVVETVIFTL